MNAFRSICAGAAVDFAVRTGSDSLFLSTTMTVQLHDYVWQQVGSWPVDIARRYGDWAMHSAWAGVLMYPLVTVLRQILFSDLCKVNQ